jgi:hypothetical protein
LQNQSVIDVLRCRTAELVAQRLRSDAVVIARLADLIQDAVQLGHSHRSIHEAMATGGLAANWNTYRVSLRRVRKARRTVPVTATTAQTPNEPTSFAAPNISVGATLRRDDHSPAPTQLAEPVEQISLTDVTSFMKDTPGVKATSLTIEIMEALRRARQTAQKDYAQIAREKHREEQRREQRERSGNGRPTLPANRSPHAKDSS